MATDQRTAVLNALARMAERYPHWRMGQLIANLAGWALSEIWDVEDNQLVDAAKSHLARSGMAAVPQHSELVSLLGEVCRRRPEWRMGQLVANLSTLASRDVWDVQDQELVAASRMCLVEPEFFSAQQQQRLQELMARWREARDQGQSLPAIEQAELESLVEAELIAAGQRAHLAAGARRWMERSN